MTVYTMERPKEAIMTMKFSSYNAAIDFSSKSGLLKPSKPYKRLVWKDGNQVPVWCVTLSGTLKDEKPTYKKAA